jgi:hypothetical protein
MRAESGETGGAFGEIEKKRRCSSARRKEQAQEKHGEGLQGERNGREP